MTLQQTKLGIAGAVIVAVLVGTYALNSSVSDKAGAGNGDGAGEMADADLRQGRLGVKSRGGSGSDKDKAKISARDDDKGSKAGGAGVDPDIASIVDTATTQVMPIETDAETRERERYEKAMANQFKYRELDPDKIKPTELTPALEAASEEYGLPKNLLAAMMYVESGGAHRDGDHSIEAGYGVMNLRENNLVDSLAEASALTGKTKEELLYNQADNIKGAAALLKSYHDDAIASGLSESEAWYAAVATYSGRSDPALAAALADETAGFLMKGFEAHLSDGGGDVVIPPTADPPFLPKDYAVAGIPAPGTEGGADVASGGAASGAGAGDGTAAGGMQVSP